MTLRLSGDRSGRIGGVCLLFYVGNPLGSDKIDQRNFVATAVSRFICRRLCGTANTRRIARIVRECLDRLALVYGFATERREA
jgi:hypothetical protein